MMSVLHFNLVELGRTPYICTTVDISLQWLKSRYEINP